VTSKANMGAMEDKYGKWDYPKGDWFVQIDSNSDPVCSSAGCTQYKHKKTKRGYDINYPVANNGVDQDMMDNEASLNQAQKDLSHDWEFGTKASKAKWKNPAKKTKYDFSPKLDS
jgi:hypothetical protein